ncbi:MAG: dethiobiotin synthase, partial [Myxococcales bacterium]|nr:dethiobiotin synthase [Myxococcales bacterium]
TLEGAAPPPDPGLLAHRVRELSSGADRLIVEGAGGLLVPLDARRTIADLARALALPLLIVAPDRLGVLSDVLTCVESATARGLTVAAVILSQHQHGPDDPSRRTNRRILQRRLPSPVLTFPSCLDDDSALADAARHCGLLVALEPSSSAI